MPIYMCTNCCNLYDVTNYINFEVTMGLDLSKLRGENRRLKSPAGGGNFLDNFVRMPEGEYGVVTVRLLPTPGAVHDLYCVTRTHKINDKNLHCPMELTENNSGGFSWTGMCPICKHYSGLWKQSDSMAPDDAAQVQALRPQLMRFAHRPTQRPSSLKRVDQLAMLSASVLVAKLRLSASTTH